MYKIILVFLLFMAEHAIGQTFIRISDGSINPEAKELTPRRTIKKTERGISVTYEFDYVEKITRNDSANASLLKIEGFGFGGEPEKPALPLRIDRFSVPSQDCQVSLLDSTYVELPMEIEPVGLPMNDCVNSNSINKINPPIKPYHGLFPKSPLSTEMYKYRENFIADIHITPVQYDYKNKMVRLFSSLSYVVDCKDDTLHNFIDRNDALLSNLVMNPIDSSAITRNATSEIEVPRHLILTIPTFSEAVEKFADWKRTIGFDAQIVYRNSWTETDVINTIASVNTDNSIRYLTIVGDYNDIPGKIVSDSIRSVDGWEHFTFPTDYYYGCVQQDAFPEIRRGRLSVSSSDQAMAVVDKIIQYEKSPITQQGFYDTGLNCAYFQDNNNDHIEDTRFTLTSEQIRDFLVDEMGKSVNRVYSANDTVNPLYWNNDAYGFWHNQVSLPADLLRSNDFHWNGNYTDIMQQINNGTFYVLHRGHGITGGWVFPTFRIPQVNNLSNGEKLPVVFSMNCRTGTYHVGTCFAEAFLRKEHGGCVAIFAATESSLSGFNDALTIGMFDAIWPSNGYFKSFPFSNNISLSSTPTYRIGDVLDIGLSHITSIYDWGNNAVSLKHTKEIFHCFGDPTMEIYTDKPSSYKNVSFTVADDIANISVPEGGKITFYNPTNGNINCYCGSNVQFPYNPDLRISITNHNKIPFIIEGGTMSIQNETLSGSVSYESDMIKVGTNVTSIRPAGDVTISGGITSLKGKLVELAPGTIVEMGAQLEINN